MGRGKKSGRRRGRWLELGKIRERENEGESYDFYSTPPPPEICEFKCTSNCLFQKCVLYGHFSGFCDEYFDIFEVNNFEIFDLKRIKKYLTFKVYVYLAWTWKNLPIRNCQTYRPNSLSLSETYACYVKRNRLRENEEVFSVLVCVEWEKEREGQPLNYENI